MANTHVGYGMSRMLEGWAARRPMVSINPSAHVMPKHGCRRVRAASHPYFESAPDLNNRNGVDASSKEFREMTPGQKIIAIGKRGYRTNGHQPRFCPWCRWDEVGGVLVPLWYITAWLK